MGPACRPFETALAIDMLPIVSPFLFKLFGRYTAWYVPRHFHALRLLDTRHPPTEAGIPAVIYLNHPSWWDPLICLLLARRFWPDRKHYAPIDAVAIERYRFFRRLGFFGVEQGSAAGSLTFLRTARAILDQPDAILWVTAQGRFTDARSRPIKLLPGLGHLLRHVGPALVIPLAVEYCFWDDNHPEALAAFGDAIEISAQPTHRPAEWTELLERALDETADLLAAGAMSRDPSRFTTLYAGNAGVSFTYDLWLRAKSLATGKPYQREHGAGLR